MNQNNHERASIFLFGAAIGVVIGLILATLFTPYSDSDNTIFDDNRFSTEDDFSKRIYIATNAWVEQLRAVAQDLVAQGRLNADEAQSQINELLDKVRS